VTARCLSSACGGPVDMALSEVKARDDGAGWLGLCNQLFGGARGFGEQEQVEIVSINALHLNRHCCYLCTLWSVLIRLQVSRQVTLRLSSSFRSLALLIMPKGELLQLQIESPLIQLYYRQLWKL
jgi:hypothetical protein